MVAKGGVGSNQTLLISVTAEAPRGLLFRSLKPRSDNKMDPEHHNKGNRFRTRWMFRQKDRPAKEPMDQAAAAIAAPASVAAGGHREGRYRELSVRWFMDTQAHLILQNGIFPSWFQGFITRKDAEKTLCDKEQGYFLIRLSEKATGYILSYKGGGRCRHFMISQSNTGQFIVAGDTRVHASLTELLEYYKKNRIEPFGEYLTYSCLEECAEELYDMIQVSHHQVAPHSHRKQEEIPPLPRRRGAPVNGCLSNQRPTPCGGEMTHGKPGRPTSGTTSSSSSSSSSSRDIGGRGVLHAGSAPGRAAWLLETQTQTKSSTSTSSRPAPPPHPHQHLLLANSTSTTTSNSSTTTEGQPHIVYSLIQPLEGKSASLPVLLLQDTHSEGDHLHKLSTHTGGVRPPPHCTSSPPPLRAAAGGRRGQQRGKMHGSGDGGWGGGGNRPISSHSLDYLCNSPVYHLATASQLKADLDDDDERSLVIGNNDCDYGLFDDNTYEPLPATDGPPRARPEPRRDSHTYESVEDLRPKPAVTPGAGAKNDKWRFFPELRRK